MLERYCDELQCTQAQLASVLGLSLAAINKWNERGEIPHSGLRAIELLIENQRLKQELRELQTAIKVLGSTRDRDLF